MNPLDILSGLYELFVFIGVVSVISLVIFFIVLFVLRKRNRHHKKSYYYPPRRRKAKPRISGKKRKGIVGEYQVASILEFSSRGKSYLFNDILLKVKDRTAQIDHILVNRAGVFIIETKNFSGRITGNENEFYWYQHAKRKHAFYNPVMQNATHHKFVKEIIGDIYPIYTMVVFVKNNKPSFSSNKVFQLCELKNFILEKTNNSVLTEEDMLKVVYLINLYISHDSNEKEKHIENARQAKQAINEGLCPRCGNPLIIKKGESGLFWGCSTFPKCMYTRKL